MPSNGLALSHGYCAVCHRPKSRHGDGNGRMTGFLFHFDQDCNEVRGICTNREEVSGWAFIWLCRSCRFADNKRGELDQIPACIFGQSSTDIAAELCSALVVNEAGQ